MMKQIFALLLMLGLLAVPVVVGAATCGDGTYLGCAECATETPCIAEVPCWWEPCDQGTQELCEAAGCTWNMSVCEGAFCNYQGVAVVETADITEIGSKAGGLSADLMPWVVLIIGVPLGFMMIKRVIGIMPKK